MPILNSTYASFITNGHLQTILPNLFRRVEWMRPRREEINTPDDDFLELDWYEQPNNDRLVILLHGLEGNSRRRYIKGMGRHLHNRGYNVLAWSYRSCGSRMNKQLRFYHSGDTEDIATIVQYVLSLEKYQSIYFVGFSMGGNIVLKYLGECGDTVSPYIKAAATFSVPLDLVGSSKVLSKWWNRIYLRRFLRTLKKKVEQKQPQYPEILTLDGYDQIKSFKGFDNKYTAPIHGFRDAFDYWEKSSSKNLLPYIKVPVLIVNAKNDTFLSDSCYPYDIAEQSEYIFLETPQTGGHVGFWTLDDTYWTERRAEEFLRGY